MLTRIKNSIPNTITCLNLLSGVAAIIFAFHFSDSIGALKGYQWAYIFIGAAALFDFCDGAAARLLHAYSDLGKELDSLADLVSFGVAPAILVFNLIGLANQDPLSPWAFSALLIPAMGALRLARFNIDTRQTTSFIGLPIPSEAIFWIGFTAWAIDGGLPVNWLTALIVLAMSMMMVSNIGMFSLKFKNFNIAENIKRYLIVIAAVALVTWLGISGLMWTILLYVVLSMINISVTYTHTDDPKD